MGGSWPKRPVLKKTGCNRSTTSLFDFQQTGQLATAVQLQSVAVQSSCQSLYQLPTGLQNTNYRAQGQTIPAVIVDIVTPPTGGLTLFNLYVVLSQSSGCSTIRLLHDFNDTLSWKGHRVELLAENDRLEGLNEQMLRWQKEMGQDTS